MATIETAFFPDRSCEQPMLAGDPSNPFGAEVLSLVCLSSNSAIEADGGFVPVDSLRPGHRIWTREAGLTPILHIARFRADPDLLEARPDLRPMHLRPGSLGLNAPGADVVLASRHRLHVRPPLGRRNGVRADAMVTAGALQEVPGVDPLPHDAPVDYVAFLLKRCRSFCVSGLICESFVVTSAMLDELFGLTAAVPRARSSLVATPWLGASLSAE